METGSAYQTILTMNRGTTNQTGLKQQYTQRTAAQHIWRHEHVQNGGKQKDEEVQEEQNWRNQAQKKVNRLVGALMGVGML